VEISPPAYQDFIGRLETERFASRVQRVGVNELSLIDSIASGWLVLTDGRIVKAGMVDAKTHERDLVCIFDGSSIPSIIHKADHGFHFVCSGEITDGPYGPGVEFDERFWAGRAQSTFELN
jgi:hypothetical protein